MLFGSTFRLCALITAVCLMVAPLRSPAARRDVAIVVSVAKWTGPDLPGSVASTLKYRLVIRASAGKHVVLDALGLHVGWIASFCSDKLCSPDRVTFEMPAGGIKTYEFQLIPPHPGAVPGKILIAIAGERPVAVP